MLSQKNLNCYYEENYQYLCKIHAKRQCFMDMGVKTKLDISD